MPKTLHLLRHAKSSWKNPELADIDRPLNKRGKRDCELIAKPIRENGCDFDNVYCSPAKRARKTLQGIEQALSVDMPPWKIDEALYTFDYKGLLHWLRILDDKLQSVVIVGHNPALLELCHYLIHNCDIENVPTCSYVQIQLAAKTWREIKEGSGKLVCFLKPKDFRQS